MFSVSILSPPRVLHFCFLPCRSFESALVPPAQYIARCFRPGLLALSSKRGLFSLEHTPVSERSPYYVLSS